MAVNKPKVVHIDLEEDGSNLLVLMAPVGMSDLEVKQTVEIANTEAGTDGLWKRLVEIGFCDVDNMVVNITSV